VDLAPNLGGVGEAAVVPPEECARAGGGGRQQPLPRQDPAVGGECGDAARESPAPGHAISPPEIAGEGGSLEEKSSGGGAVCFGVWMGGGVGGHGGGSWAERTAATVLRRYIRPVLLDSSLFFLLGNGLVRSATQPSVGGPHAIAHESACYFYCFSLKQLLNNLVAHFTTQAGCSQPGVIMDSFLRPSTGQLCARSST
jgi:hypothetical protein